MISRLTIKNVALIDNAEITFGGSLNVLSGETGAGKSVILDSVNFVLGAKADKTMIRYGENECFVKAEFSVDENSPVLKELEEMDIDADTDIIISRKYNLDGKGNIKINGNTVTAAMLKRITGYLVDVHGQSEHFYLLKESNQLKVLDSICGDGLKSLKDELVGYRSELKEIKSALALFSGDVSERNRRIDVLKFQIDEIDSASLKEGEEEECREKLAKINNVEKIAKGISEAASYFSSDNAALDLIKNAKRSLNQVSRYSKEYTELLDRIEELLGEAQDIGDTLSDISDNLYFDERELEEVENRLDTIKALKKKYGNGIEEILSYCERAREELDMLLNCDEQFELLTSKKNALLKKAYSVCERMSALRRKEGKEFALRVVNELKTLNIPRAEFYIEFKEFSFDDVENFTENGLDGVCFMFSANAGEPVKPLGKIISGGEMSRFMLSIKTQLSGINGISTYIFDEIDAGISGKTAKVVGEKIAKIAKKTQVIAVSHLAQIACMADSQMLIKKQESEEKTLTKVFALNREGRTQEIVRLLGGESDSEIALSHAKELLKQAEEYKNTI